MRRDACGNCGGLGHKRPSCPSLVALVSQKSCKDCLETKPLSEFTRSSLGRLGRRTRCRICESAYSVSRYTALHAKKCRSRALKRKYGISAADFTKMEADQGGGCLICGGVNKSGPLHVDHSHVSGEIRGLLCSGCNQGLGSFQDSPELCEKAAEYLRRSSVVAA